MAERAYAPTSTEILEGRSLPEILRSVLRDVENIVRAEVRLGRAELMEKAHHVKRTGAVMGAAAIAGFFSAACLIATFIALIALALPLWVSTLIAACLLGLGAIALYAKVRSRLD